MKDELRPLIDKAIASLNAANLLHKEGYHDFAASRAYYAMFYVTSAMLLHKGLSFSSHSAVIAAFGKEFAKTGELDAKYHRYLISAERLRTASDYASGISIEIVDVDEVLQRAEEFIAEARTLLESGV